jgi:hypothetical protein
VKNRQQRILNSPFEILLSVLVEMSLPIYSHSGGGRNFLHKMKLIQMFLLTENDYNFLASSQAEGLLQDTGNMQD